jgi:hypothetical protein
MSFYFPTFLTSADTAPTSADTAPTSVGIFPAGVGIFPAGVEAPSPSLADVLDAAWLHQPVVYLALAGLCMIVVLRFLKRALSPIGALVQAVAAAAVVSFAAVIAFAMLILAALTSMR